MSDAPFVETPVTDDSANADASAARQRLQADLAKLDPASGSHAAPAVERKKKPKLKR